ncbi:MAG: hypothetical protein WKF96_22945 [Solirubrobacteraceae bacterium]
MQHLQPGSARGQDPYERRQSSRLRLLARNRVGWQWTTPPPLCGSEQDARRTLVDLRAAGVDLDEVADLLLRQGIEAFAMAMGGLLDSIQRRRA